MALEPLSLLRLLDVALLTMSSGADKKSQGPNTVLKDTSVMTLTAGKTESPLSFFPVAQLE